MQKKHVISIIVIFSLIIGVFSWFYAPGETKSEEQIKNATVFVHGYKGTKNSFGNMLKRFENKYGWGQRALVYRISPAGNLDVNVYGKETGDVTDPIFVHVIFDNNRASIQNTSAWLAKVLAHMKETFQFNIVNLVGHSMGGLVTMDYTQTYQNKRMYPKVNKLVAIGTPFDGVYNEDYFRIHHDPAAENLKPDSEALKRLRLNKDVISEQLRVLSIGSTGDSVAVPQSVGAIKNIVPEAQLTYEMIHDNTLGHSELHEDVRVDRMVYSFLNSENEQTDRITKD
ncbi:alpha/beta hydrolase [Lentibacillus jeotgali]|uniref:alpha/beta hydrolase n=1 Tax=Lentibacillus jeotgali TaxID=558169 RepID=UPI00026277DC|nr:alpha/beta hydrolase [Lentibacillus jeotgali]